VAEQVLAAVRTAPGTTEPISALRASRAITSPRDSRPRIDKRSARISAAAKISATMTLA